MFLINYEEEEKGVHDSEGVFNEAAPNDTSAKIGDITISQVEESGGNLVSFSKELEVVHDRCAPNKDKGAHMVEQGPSFSTNTGHTYATRRRSQKWKKVIRDRDSSLITPAAPFTIGEKRTKIGDAYDEQMEEEDDRGNFKKGVVPMEIETSTSQDVGNVADPTTWALGS